RLAPKTILDVGCGSGSLTAALRLLDYQRYLGIDVSAEAIAQARTAFGDNRTDFAVATAESYVPEDRFDGIIFNQVAYSFAPPGGIVGNYARFLSPAGRVIVSMSDHVRNNAAWKLILERMATEHWIRIVQADGSATTRLLAAR